MVAVDPGALAEHVRTARPTDCRGLRRLGLELMLLGDFDAALDQLDRALELAESERDTIAVWITVGDVHRYRGDGATGESFYRTAVAAARSAESVLLSFALQHLGKGLAEQGRVSEARAVLEEALALRLRGGDPELIESTRLALAKVEHLATGCSTN
ncbi:tetratricopeptide repeat protein [Nocardia cyriacigeorgica]|uniref:Tetratricopeptide repeat protein n=1 Tax=Nocardia cyriacigeorgica TaxID=135487 RepID=A0A5R8PIR1_9NOCA|nr:tetratricopeptide repeat protein [Nocardia cyriacigeorgica]TLG16433.1 tetratricopeptide repeat protein [Nocardia cyriacigeorgica]